MIVMRIFRFDIFLHGGNKMLSTLITAVGIIVSIFGIIQTFLAKSNKKIRYWQVETESIFSNKIKEIEGLKIEYKNEELSDNVIILKTVIENNGEKDIDESIVYAPMKISFNKSIKVLDVELLDAPDGIAVLTENNSIICDWNLLKKKEFFVLKILLKIEEEEIKAIKSDELLKKYTEIDYRITDVNKAKKINYTKVISEKISKFELISYSLLALFFYVFIAITFSLDFYQVRYESPIIKGQYYSLKGKSENKIKIFGEEEKKTVTLKELNDVQKDTKIVLVKETINIPLLIFISIASIIVSLPTIFALNEYRIDKRVKSFFKE